MKAPSKSQPKDRKPTQPPSSRKGSKPKSSLKNHPPIHQPSEKIAIMTPSQLSQFLHKLHHELSLSQKKQMANCQYWSAQITNATVLIEHETSQTIKLLIEIFKRQPRSFFSWPSKQDLVGNVLAAEKEVPLRGVFIFFKLVATHFSEFPFMEREMVSAVSQETQRLVIKGQLILNEAEAHSLEKLTQEIIYYLYKQKSHDSIHLKCFEFILAFHLASFLHIPKLQLTPSLNCLNRILQIIIDQTTFFLEKQEFYSHQIQSLWLNFYQQSLRSQFSSAWTQPCQPVHFPIYKFGMMSIFAKSNNVFKEMMKITVKFFKETLDQSENQVEKTNNCHDSSEKKDERIKVVLMCTSIFRFQINNSSQLDQVQHFLLLIYYKSFINRLIVELEKIAISEIDPKIIRSLFEVTVFCQQVNHKNILIKIIQTIEAEKQLENVLKLALDLKEPPINQQISEKDDKKEQFFSNACKISEKHLYDLRFKIEKTLILYPLEIYTDLYIAFPNIFRSDYFMANLLEHQSQQSLKNLVVGLTDKWIADEFHHFYIETYILQFFETCIQQDRTDMIGKYIIQISLGSFLKLNTILFKKTFEEDSKRSNLNVSETSQSQVEFASVTSSGLFDKMAIIDRIIPICSQQIMWKEMTQHLYQNSLVYTLKCFYNSFCFEIYSHLDQLETNQRMNALIHSLQDAINARELESVQSIFHLLLCLFVNNSSGFPWTQLKNHYAQQILTLILNHSDAIIHMCEVVCESRKNAMWSMQLGKEAITNNLKSFEKSKKMHWYFLKEIIKFIESLQSLQSLLSKADSVDIILDKINQIAKETDSTYYHALNQLSQVSSSATFANLIYEIKKRKSHLNFNHFLLIRQCAWNLLRKYEANHLHKDFQIDEILDICIEALGRRMEVSNERELLRCKIICLQIINEMKQYCKVNSEDQFTGYFMKRYCFNLKQIFKELLLQNPALISKYERELILHIRMQITTKFVFAEYKSAFEVLAAEETWLYCLYLCFDRMHQMRLLLINSLLSRFKSIALHLFQAEKIKILAILTFICIYSPEDSFREISKVFIEEYRVIEDIQAIGIIVFFNCVKLLVSFINQNLIKNEYFITVDFMVIHFDKIWFKRKDHELMAIEVARRFLVSSYEFVLIPFGVQAHIEFIHIAREKTDYEFQREIKQVNKEGHLRAQLFADLQGDYCIESEAIPTDNKITDKFCSRIFQNLQLVIKQKAKYSAKSSRNKEMLVSWDYFEKLSILRKKKRFCEQLK